MRLSELALLSGNGAAAIDQITKTIEEADRIEGGSAVLPALRRLHAAALLQSGAIEQGADELQIALASARSRGDAYETALLLDLTIGISRQSGRPADSDEQELAVLRDRLGIVALPSVPLTLEPRPTQA